MSERMKTIVVLREEEDDAVNFVFSGKLDDMIASLVKIREMVPLEYKSAAHCEIEAHDYYDCHYCTIEVSYKAEETEEDVAAREAAEKARLQAELQRHRANAERAMKRLQHFEERG